MSTDPVIRLRPRARLMKALGEELISNEQVALIELVKNSYDADATIVVVRFIGPLHEGEGAVEVWDNGHGMGADNIQPVWMDIATDHRLRSHLSESRGRRVLGAKGIGRFAAMRLAYRTEVVTRRTDQGEVAFKIDWEPFADPDAYLDDMAITWEQRAPTVFSGEGEALTVLAREQESTGHTTAVAHGTVVRLAALRRDWNAVDIGNLRQALSRLIPPPPPAELDVPAEAEFSVWLDVPSPHEGLSGPIAASEALAHPEYRIVGIVDADGTAHLTYLERENAQSEDYEVDLRQPGATDLPSCGPLKLDIRAWNLEADSVRRLLRLETGARNISEIRSLIRKNAGIALYRDGFRVQPYGEPGNDWLQLDPRRVNNPTMRLSNNQIAGFVYITADDNPELRDRSHREGLIDAPQYESLKATLIAAINVLEQRRYAARRPASSVDGETQRERARGIFEAFSLGPLRRTISQRYPDDAVLNEAFDEVEEEVREGVQHVQEVLSRFSRLASLGALVDVVLHDGRGALNRIAFAMRDLNKAVTRSAAGNDVELSNALTKVAESLEKQRDALDRLFRRIEPLSGRRRGRPRRISLHEVLNQAAEVIDTEAKAQTVSITVEGDDQTITADPGDILQIMVNLLQNAIYWLSTLPEQDGRRITITTNRGDDRAVTIDVSDSGPGVAPKDTGLIFDPYYSTRPDGVGLGLSIAGSIAKDFYDGDLELLTEGEQNGATFRITLRRRIG